MCRAVIESSNCSTLGLPLLLAFQAASDDASDEVSDENFDLWPDAGAIGEPGDTPDAEPDGPANAWAYCCSFSDSIDGTFIRPLDGAVLCTVTGTIVGCISVAFIGFVGCDEHGLLQGVHR